MTEVIKPVPAWLRGTEPKQQYCLEQLDIRFQLSLQFLPLEVLIKIAADNIFVYLFIFVFFSNDSHEMSSLIFTDKKKK